MTFLNPWASKESQYLLTEPEKKRYYIWHINVKIVNL